MGITSVTLLKSTAYMYVYIKEAYNYSHGICHKIYYINHKTKYCIRNYSKESYAWT